MAPFNLQTRKVHYGKSEEGVRLNPPNPLWIRHWKIGKFLYEPRHDKTNKVSVPPAKTDQPGHPPSLIRVFAVCMKKAWVLSYPLSAQRRLWSDWADAQADLSLRWAHAHFVGFVMSRLISMFSDINECLEGSDNCLQECRNVPGSFECFCYPGFLRGGNTCIGKLWVSECRPYFNTRFLGDGNTCICKLWVSECRP